MEGLWCFGGYLLFDCVEGTPETRNPFLLHLPLSRSKPFRRILNLLPFLPRENILLPLSLLNTHQRGLNSQHHIQGRPSPFIPPPPLKSLSLYKLQSKPGFAFFQFLF